MTLVQTAVRAAIRTQYHVTMETTSHRPSVLEEESKIIAVKETGEKRGKSSQTGRKYL